jgi:hypothetical protein
MQTGKLLLQQQMIVPREKSKGRRDCGCNRIFKIYQYLIFPHKPVRTPCTPGCMAGKAASGMLDGGPVTGSTGHMRLRTLNIRLVFASSID